MKMRRIVSMLLVLCMVLGMMPSGSIWAADVVASGTCGENLTWALDSEGTLTISGEGDMWDTEHTGTPWDGHDDEIKVVVMGADVADVDAISFFACENLAEIRVEEGAKYLSLDDRGVLYSKDKTTLYLAPKLMAGHYEVLDSVSSIKFAAFHSCSGITGIVLPEGLVSIEQHTFSGCSNLVSINIPESVTSIGYSAFEDCTSLTTLHIPANVEDIDTCSWDNSWSDLFENCSSLTGIWVDENNDYYSSDDKGVLFDKEQTVLIRAPGALAEDYIVPDGVESIALAAFADCRNITGVWIPSSVEHVNMDVPNHAAIAFYGNTSLTGIWVNENNPYYSSDERGVLFDKEKTMLIRAPGALTGEYSVPDSVVTIDSYGFCGCTEVTCIRIPDSVTDIYYMALDDCSSLTGIWVDENNLNYSSDDCGVLFDKEKIELLRVPMALAGAYTVPQGVSTIYGAFGGCSKLTSISLPDSVTGATGGDFNGCSSLTGIWVNENNPYYSSDERGVLFDKEKTELIRAPGALAGAYTVPQGVSTIESAFSGCTGLTSISIPDSVTLIHGNPFYGCIGLKTIYFLGDAPGITWWGDLFGDIVATAYYPEGNATWTSEVMRDYGGTITWIAYAPGAEPWNNPFTDVPSDKYYYEPVLWAYENGITTGATATTFAPNKDCTRGQIVTFLWRAAGEPEPTATNNPFTDVDSDDFYYKAVLWAVENGITTGASATKFNPKGACNRAQVVTFMWRAKGSPTPTSANNPFGDVPADKYYHDAVLWAVENGITTGTSATKFAPNNTCTRGQIVTFLYRGYAE